MGANQKKKRTDACSLHEGPGGDSPGRQGLGLERANPLRPNATNKTGPYPKPPWQRPRAEPRFPSSRDCCEAPQHLHWDGIRGALQRSRTSGMAQEEWEQPTQWGLTPIPTPSREELLPSQTKSGKPDFSDSNKGVPCLHPPGWRSVKKPVTTEI